MKNIFYVAEKIQAAVLFINANTDWKRVTNVSFVNGDEKIIVISDFNQIMGRKVDGVYIDYSFTRIRDSRFVERFLNLKITPIKIEEINVKFESD